MIKDKFTLILIAVIVLGFLLRFWGFQFEYLFNSIDDESYQGACLLRMIQNKSLDPNGCPNPYPALFVLIHFPSVIIGLFALLLKANFDLDVFRGIIAVYPFSILPAIRLFSIIAGASQIFLIYKITKSLFGSSTKGLIAAIFMAVSLMPVQMSHWGRPWTLSLFFTLLTLYSGIQIYKTGERKHYILSAIFASSGIGIHYSGFFAAVFIAFGHFFRKIKTQFRGNKNFYLAVFLTILFSALWIFLNRTEVYNEFLGSDGYSNYYYQGSGIAQYFSNAFLFLKHFAAFDPVVFLLYAAALLINFRKLFTFEYLFLTLFFIFYLAFMVFASLGTYSRWSLPLIAVSLPIVADFLGDLKTRFKARFSYGILIVFLLLPSLFFSATWDYMLNLPNTRFAAKDWIEKNLPINSKVLFLDETSVLAESQEGAKYLNEALSGIRPPNPRYLYLAERGQNVFPGYQAVTNRQFLDNRSYFESQPFDYYVLSYSNESEYQEKVNLIPDQKELELIKEILPFDQSVGEAGKKRRESFDPEQGFSIEYLEILRNIRMTGPTIEIYRKIIKI
ncbi:MAG: glycosyltransferase family 39 protein [Candidatus Nealsonbacteria bacterium]|nr:glycosyltransferase family 39 protein [Candidatus Nealsonbacteria bacterium]